MNILIVDDDKACLRSLNRIVTDMCVKKGITCNVSTLFQPYLLLDNEKYKHCDVILLDIEMFEASGIDIISQIDQIKSFSEKPYISLCDKP